MAFKICQNLFSAGALPRTPPGELTTLPRLPSRLERGHPSPYPTPFGTYPPSALAMRPLRIPARSTPMTMSIIHISYTSHVGWQLAQLTANAFNRLPTFMVTGLSTVTLNSTFLLQQWPSPLSILILPTHWWMARLSWPRWLIKIIGRQCFSCWSDFRNTAPSHYRAFTERPHCSQWRPR